MGLRSFSITCTRSDKCMFRPFEFLLLPARTCEVPVLRAARRLHLHVRPAERESLSTSSIGAASWFGEAPDRPRSAWPSRLEAAHKTALAKGEFGIKDREPALTLAVFAPQVRRGHRDVVRGQAGYLRRLAPRIVVVFSVAFLLRKNCN